MFFTVKHSTFKNTIGTLVLIFLTWFYLTCNFSCTKDEPRLMKVMNDSITEISVATVKVYATVIDIGEGVDQYGHCWSKSEDPTLENCESSTSLGVINKTGPFVDVVTNLDSKELYYIKAYLKKGGKIVYSNALSFSTLAATKPDVRTDTTEEILPNSIVINGTILSTGLTATGILDYGHCWSYKTATPTINDSLTSLGSRNTPGSFTSTILNLKSNTLYYVRAYAANEAGPAYGITKKITTASSDIPVVSTSEVTDITVSGCKCGGNVISQGGDPVTLRGVCWGLQRNPDYDDKHTTDGSGTGSYISTVTGCASNTYYYIRAYAKNSFGFGYGQTDSFRTSTAYIDVSPDSRSVSSSSGSTSFSVSSNIIWNVVDDASWLTVTKVNGNTINVSYETNTSTSSRTATITVTGTESLIKKVTVIQPGVSTKPTLTTAEITNPTTTSATSGGYNINDGGETITVKGVYYGTSPNPTESDGSTNNGSGTGDFVSNLSGLSPGTLYYVRAYAINSIGTGYGQDISFRTPEPSTKPGIITTNVSSITAYTAVSGGTITDDGGETITAKGVCWSESPEPTSSNGTCTNEGEGSGTFFSTMTMLKQLTTYYVRAYATNAIGTAYGSDIEFKTDFECGTQLIDPRDAQTYNTVMIGDQCWMAQNLNTGILIDVTENQTNNQIIEKYCYGNEESGCDIYGAIYQWDEMMQYTTIESTQGVCPSGWHLPSDHEWKIMEIALGMSEEAADSFYWRGTTEGGKLKVPGTYYWESTSSCVSNSSWFTALPAGWDSNKSFVERNYSAVFWTSTSTIDQYAWYRYLTADQCKIYRDDGYRPNGTSVRCIRDN